MKRKMLLILLCVTLIFSLSAPAVAAKAEETEPLTVAVTTHSNLVGTVDVRGLYRDNYFYIDAQTVADMTGAQILSKGRNSVEFSMHGGLRVFSVSSEDKVTETAGKQKKTLSMETVVYENALYISAPDILSYAGATVGFGKDEKAELHMMVTMPYTLCDLYMEYYDYDGMAFSWAEAEGKVVDPEDVLELAALDTVLLGYDSNVVAYALPGYADNVENNILTDVLLELLRNEGSELVHAEDPSVEILDYLSDNTEVSFAWIQKTMEWASETDIDKQLAEKWSKQMDGAGLVVELTAGCISSLETAKQFTNLATTQKVLLEKTLCRVSPRSDIYQAYPTMFQAAQSANALIKGEYSAGEKAAHDAIYTLLGEAVEAVIPPNPISASWSVLTGIAKIDPLLSSLLSAEQNITFAGECSNVRILASRILSTDAIRMTQNNNFLGIDTIATQEQMKYDIILSLKASLTARLLLLDTGWLTESAQQSMQMKAEWTAELLNKAQNARPIAIGVYEENEEDISWIEKLACVGKMGNVITIGSDTYYWRYNDSSFYDEGFSYFSYQSATNSFVCRDKTGKQNTLFALPGHGEFIIANRTLFYENNDREICSIGLDGTQRKNWGAGTLCAVTEDGMRVICRTFYGDNALDVIDLQKGTRDRLVFAQQFVTYHDGVIYYTKEVDYEQGQKGKVDLWSICPDGTKNIHLYTTKADLYEYSSGYSTAAIDQIRFTEKYVYFSYGSQAGTGFSFQGGKIARVRYDGTDGKVVAGQNGLVDGQFTVSANDQVTSQDLLGLPLWGMGNPLHISNGYIYRYDAVSGEPKLMVSPDDYGIVEAESDGIVVVGFVEEHGGKVYYMVHGAINNTTPMSWRESYTRKTTALLVKDLETGKITTLYKI